MTDAEQLLADLSEVLSVQRHHPDLVEAARIVPGQLDPGLPAVLTTLNGLELIGYAALVSRDEEQLQSTSTTYWRTPRSWHELELELRPLLEGDWRPDPHPAFSTLLPGFRPRFGYVSYLRGLEHLTVGLGRHEGRPPIFQASLQTLSVTAASQLAEHYGHARQAGPDANPIPALQPPERTDPVFQRTSLSTGVLVMGAVPLPELLDHYAHQLRAAGWTLLEVKEFLSSTLQFWQTQAGELAVLSAVPSPQDPQAVNLTLNVLQPPSEDALKGNIGWTFFYS